MITPSETMAEEGAEAVTDLIKIVNENATVSATTAQPNETDQKRPSLFVIEESVISDITANNMKPNCAGNGETPDIKIDCKPEVKPERKPSFDIDNVENVKKVLDVETNGQVARNGDAVGKGGKSNKLGKMTPGGVVKYSRIFKKVREDS